ncbi:MAG: AMP-binding protein [Deferribacteraceae bacterium]|nr:AMP-binding protein [Deferribacteraceae bacterium]
MIDIIENILNSDSEQTGFYYKNTPVSYARFANLVKKYYLSASESVSKEVVLYCDDLLFFMASFLGVLSAGKDVALPSHRNPNPGEVFSLLPVEEYDTKLSEIVIPKISSEANIMFHTSGSTGVPKIIKKRFANLEAEALYLLTLLSEYIKQKPTFITTVNINHMYGIFYAFLAPFCKMLPINADIVLTPEQVMSHLKNYDKVFLVSSPSFLERVGKYKDEYRFDIAPVCITSSGGPLRESPANNVYEQFGVYPLEIFGSTETGGVAHSVLSAVNGWTIFDPVDAVLSQNECLLVKSGFIDAPFEMADKIKFIEPRRFILKERTDRLIKFEEKRVSLPEIESYIKNIPFVDNAYTILVSRDKPFIGCCVTLNGEGKKKIIQVGKKGIVDFIRKELSKYTDIVCIPSKWRIIEEIPVNTQGKVLPEKILNIFSNNIAEPVIINKQITDNTVLLKLIFLKDSVYFKGHFPQYPILPGVIQTHFAIHWAKKYLMKGFKVSRIIKLKFTNIVTPGETITLSISKVSDGFTFKYFLNEKVYSSGVIHV